MHRSYSFGLSRYKSYSTMNGSDEATKAWTTNRSSSETVFSKILRREIPADILHEDDKVIRMNARYCVFSIIPQHCLPQCGKRIPDSSHRLILTINRTEQQLYLCGKLTLVWLQGSGENGLVSLAYTIAAYTIAAYISKMVDFFFFFFFFACVISTTFL